jgi:hypothetical protein
MRRILAVLTVLIAITTGIPAHAQTVQTGDCAPGVPSAADLASVYRSFEAAMQITVYPCGVEVLWSNENGTHRAGYAITGRFNDGGLLARIQEPDPWVGSLDGRVGIGVKPAEPGFLQVITTGPFADNVRIYRLQKVG